MQESITPSPQALKEALDLSAEILADIELSRVTLTVIALKASRLARLLNHFDAQEVFRYEASGYPITSTGVQPEVWRLAEMAGRTFKKVDGNPPELKKLAYLESLEQLEMQIEVAKIALQAAHDRDVSVSSSNPQQYVFTPMGNFMERKGLREQIEQASQRLSSRLGLLYDYVSKRHYELKFSSVAQDVFSAIRSTVDKHVADTIPTAVNKFNAVHENLRSSNPEDWSNAVHSCRRILQDLADAVFPPQTEARAVTEEGKSREIKLGKEQYINRLVCFVQDNSGSERFEEIVGSHLRFLGDRLDSIFHAAQKGSHSSVGQEEANRYVVYTYMVVGDILSLKRQVQEKEI